MWLQVYDDDPCDFLLVQILENPLVHPLLDFPDPFFLRLAPQLLGARERVGSGPGQVRAGGALPPGGADRGPRQHVLRPRAGRLILNKCIHFPPNQS